MRVLTYVGAMVVMSGATGCSVATTTAGGASPPRTVIIVQNKSPLNVEVYMWDGWDRATRLGYVEAGDTVDLDVPETVLAATGPYSLEARPTASAEYPTNSERFALREGYRITWAIPAADAVGAAAAEPVADTAPSLPGQ